MTVQGKQLVTRQLFAVLALAALAGCDAGVKPEVVRRGKAQLNNSEYVRLINDTLVFVEAQFNMYGNIFNVANPDTPYQILAGSSVLSGGDAVFKDGIGYATWSPWVRSIDVRDPRVPTTIDSLYLPLAGLVSLSGNRLYTATADSFFIIDVSRPDSLVLIGQAPYLADTFALQKAPYSLAADGDRLFLSWRGYSDPQMELYDVSNPQAPVLLDAIRLVGTWETWGPPKAARFLGDYVIYGNGYGLVSVRLDDNRTRMTLVDSLDLYDAYIGGRDSGVVETANVDGISLSGRHAVCATRGLPSFAVVDVSNPRRLRYVMPYFGDTGMPYNVDDLVANGDFIYMAQHQTWLLVVEMP
jgi:hypothetical protein